MNTDILENAVITGGSGMVGSTINFGYKPTSLELNVTNINSIEKYFNTLKKVTCIIHLASINLRDSENNHINAINVNINGTINMLSMAMKMDIPFILFSSGAVFSSDNNNSKFDEQFEPSPNCMYGITKSSSENISLLYNKTIIIRTGWLFGGHQKTHYKFVENVINNLTMNTVVKASNDFIGSPTYVIDLIEKMKFIITTLKYGINHIVNEGEASGYDIAMEIANILNKDYSLINSVSASLVPNAGPSRSKSEVLTTQYSFNKLRDWKISLREYITFYLSNNNIINTNKINIDTDNNKNEIKTKYWKNREKCRLCDSYNLHIFFNLEHTPPANHFVSKPVIQNKIPLDICICNDCKHIQLIQIIDPCYQYSDYFYVSSTSNTMVNHLKNNVNYFIEFLNLSKIDNILEIGANDGACVKHLLESGFVNILGIDPAVNIHKRHKLPIICDYFGSNSLGLFKNKIFKLIYAFHCCAHIEDIQDVFRSVYELLDENGTFIIEVGYFYDIFKNNSFDTIYHEHIDYHTCRAIQSFSLKHNLLLYKVRETMIQGGSIQFFFTKNLSLTIDESVNQTLKKENEISLHQLNVLNTFKLNVLKCGKDINFILNSLIKGGKKVAGYGASAKSTTFLHQFKLSRDIFEFIIDDNIYKQQFYSPGLHIPIRSFDILQTEKIDYIIILSWNFANELIEKLEPYRKNGTRIIIPFPEIKFI
jgi:dTDP-4-dehydrorhamnose reductase